MHSDILCCFYKSLRIGIAILDEVTKVFKVMPGMIFYPLIKYVILIGISAIFLYTVALLATSGELIAPEINSSVANGVNTNYDNYVPNP